MFRCLWLRSNDAIRRFYKEHLTKEKVDQLIEDCKTIQYYYTINNMSQKILLDKINIPGIKPTKYTVKTGLCFSRKSPENINTEK
jgi:hypothetical protein